MWLDQDLFTVISVELLVGVVIQYAVSVTILLLKLMVTPLVGIISHALVAEMSCICLNQGARHAIM